MYVVETIRTRDVVRVLDQLVELYGRPTTIKSDNGPEFVAKKFQEWIEDRRINARFIDPGSPWQNGHNESFNGVFRDGCLNRWLFESVREAREATEANTTWSDPMGRSAGVRPRCSLNSGKNR
ncbi:MAG: IS3 family transposase, partial [Deltaproteobacteria bacterium]|nr:IS3 family transposase [Deltaproteobacteria bacterium]